MYRRAAGSTCCWQRHKSVVTSPGSVPDVGTPGTPTIAANRASTVDTVPSRRSSCGTINAGGVHVERQRNTDFVPQHGRSHPRWHRRPGTTRRMADSTPIRNVWVACPQPWHPPPMRINTSFLRTSINSTTPPWAATDGLMSVSRTSWTRSRMTSAEGSEFRTESLTAGWPLARCFPNRRTNLPAEDRPFFKPPFGDRNLVVRNEDGRDPFHREQLARQR